MNRPLFAFTALLFITIIFELIVVIVTAEPTYRHHRGLIIDKNDVAVNCASNNLNLSKCRSKLVNFNSAESIQVKKYGDEHDENYENKVENEETMSNIMGLTNENDIGDDYGDDDVIEEGRGKKKGKKQMGKYLFMLAAAMKGTLLYAMIHGVAILAGKALVIAKVALALAAAVALKKALEHQDKTSYEIVKHPQHTYAQTHSSSIDYEHHGGFEGHRRRRKRRYVR